MEGGRGPRGASSGRRCVCTASDGMMVPRGHRFWQQRWHPRPRCPAAGPQAVWSARGAAVVHGRGLLGGRQPCPMAAKPSCVAVWGQGGIRSREQGCASLLPSLPKFPRTLRPLLGSTGGLTCFQQIPSSFRGQSPLLPLVTSSSGHSHWDNGPCAPGGLEQNTGGWVAEKQTFVSHSPGGQNDLGAGMLAS